MDNIAVWISPAFSAAGLLIGLLVRAVSVKFPSYRVKLEGAEVTNENHKWARPAEMLRHVSEKAQASLIIVALSFVLMSLFLSANFVGHTNQNASTENQVTEQKTEQAQRYKQDTSVYRMPNTTFGEKFEAGIEFMGGIRVINTLFVLAFGFITVSLIAHLVVIESAAKAWCDRFVHMIDT